MAYRTFGDLSLQVQQELDIEDEEFIQPTELIRYFNSAVTIVESEIIKIGLREKYLQGEALISTVNGQADYPLPADIIDNKIRKIIYRDGVTIYEIPPMRGEDQYEAEDVFNLYPGTDYFNYMIYKTGSNSSHILRLVPKATKAVANAMRMIYWKDLNRYTADGTLCDVPEICYEFVMSYVRYRVYLKETHVNTASEKEDMAILKALMSETLQGQVSDPNIDLIDQDLSSYQEQS